MLLLLAQACGTNPVTGRSQLLLQNDSQINAMALQEYNGFLRQNKVVPAGTQTEMVRRAGVRIQKAVEQYFANQNQSQVLAGYAWEFNLVDEPTVNAWCMPGGKVVVYTGILPVTQTEEGLAVVMGHEVAHAVAKHGNERMSQAMLQQLGGMALDVALRDKSAQTRTIFGQAYGLGTQFGVMLPFGRTQESEADRMGLIFMSMAGYNPEAAVPFWQRMAAAGGQQPPEFMSTHPSHETRIADIQKWLPEAKQVYRTQ